ncbi:hypothetical protein DMENIID0001_075410 [Sergentomyia squamirostris]
MSRQQHPMFQNLMPNGLPPQMNTNGQQYYHPQQTPQQHQPQQNVLQNLPHMPPPLNSQQPVAQKLPPQMNLVNGSGASSRTASPSFGTTIPQVQHPPGVGVPPPANTGAWNSMQRMQSSANTASQSNFNNNLTPRSIPPPVKTFTPLKTSTPNQSFNLNAGMQHMSLNSNNVPPIQSPQTVAGVQPLMQPMYPMQTQQQPPFNGHSHQHQQPLQYQPQQLHQYQFANSAPQYPAAASAHAGFNRLWGNDSVDLLENRHILPPEKVQPPPIRLQQQLQESVNCSSE